MNYSRNLYYCIAIIVRVYNLDYWHVLVKVNAHESEFFCVVKGVMLVEVEIVR